MHMTTEPTSSEKNRDNLTRTTTDVDKTAWCRVRWKATREDQKTSKQFKPILREHLGIDEDANE